MAVAQPKDNKKKLGVYYTPKHVAEMLCDWAIKSKEDRILEPSFGGCEFLGASQERFLKIGSSPVTSKSQIFGCDIDSVAFEYLAKIVNNPNGNFIHDDFLKLTPDSFDSTNIGFDAVVGNPPYVSHHNMDDSQKLAGVRALKSRGLELGGRASLWAYFVLHSLQFLKEKGRMAWVLPSSFLFSDYSEKVRDALRAHFTHCLIIQLGERLFLDDGTEEISVITLCNNYSLEPQDGIFEVVYAATIDDADSLIKEWSIKENSGILNNPNRRKKSDDKFSNLYAKFSELTTTVTLGTISNVEIGIVSGANSFFILSEEAWKKQQLTEEIISYVLTKFRLVPGINLLPKDVEKIKSSGIPCMLVDTTKANDISGTLDKYLDSFPKNKIETMSTFTRRSRSGVWHKFNDNRPPDAFFPYMHDQGPAIALNEARVNCTNSIHRLYWHSDIEINFKKLATISILSTFSQISAELEGRTYGAGVLKHEPSEVAKIKILLPMIDPDNVDAVFEKIDTLFRNGNKVEARKLADDLVLSQCEDSIKEKYRTLFVKELAALRSKRLRVFKSPQ